MPDGGRLPNVVVPIPRGWHIGVQISEIFCFVNRFQAFCVFMSHFYCRYENGWKPCCVKVFSHKTTPPNPSVSYKLFRLGGGVQFFPLRLSSSTKEIVSGYSHPVSENKCRIFGFKLHTSDDRTVESFPPEKEMYTCWSPKVSIQFKIKFFERSILCSKGSFCKYLRPSFLDWNSRIMVISSFLKTMSSTS